MATPPRDAEGRAKPYDDPDLSDDAYVVRYIPPEGLTSDGSGGRRLSTGAFSPTRKDRDPYRGMSGDVLELMLRDGLPLTGRKGPQHEGVVKLKVGDLRGLGLKVGKDPTQENPYHVSVWGVATRKKRKNVCEKAEWIDKPSDVDL